MSRKSVSVTVLLMITLMVTACNSHTERPPHPQSLIKAGQPLYDDNCAKCHQKDGNGKPGQYPKLAGNPLVTLEDPIPAITIVTYGKGSMPGFSDTLDPDQIAEILSYIRNSWGNQAPAVDSRQIP
jgi:mono/diheme cytochrome c family protein